MIVNDYKISPFADLRDADLHGADLHGADLRGAYLHGADLRGADLRYADLRDVYLINTNLCRADLSYANLRGAVIRINIKLNRLVSITNIGTRNDTLFIFDTDHGMHFQTGCFFGTAAAFDEAIEQTHNKASAAFNQYKAAIAFARVWEYAK